MARNVRGRLSRGSVYGITLVALAALIASAALTVDLGRVVYATQLTQQIADSAALAGASRPIMGDPVATRGRISEIVFANNQSHALQVTSASGDTALFGPSDSVPGYRVLDEYEEAVAVVAHAEIPFVFARMFGLEGTSVTRHATAVRSYAPGIPMCPMWVSADTPYRYGELQQLLMADGPHCANIPGSFGFLQPLTGSNDFLEMLRGYNIPQAKMDANYVEVGGILTAYTGLSVGQWVGALSSSNDGLARLQRATWPQYAEDDIYGFRRDNPRLLIIPMCYYLGGTGSNAQFQIAKFGVFWLEQVVQTGQKSIWGRFVSYTSPSGGDLLTEFAGVWTSRLVR